MARSGLVMRLPLICALAFAAFHLLSAVSTLLATHGTGEGQAFTVALFDFPLVLLLQALPRGGYILYDSPVAYVWSFSIAGTLMYAAIGYCFGVLLRALVLLITRKNETGRGI
jgi:hypothetical protein